MYQFFFKYQATGNDFVMIDNRQNDFDGSDTGLIQRLCDRRFGVGADGLILIANDPDEDFNMRYFNADGKEASMCGNGGRCAVAFAKYLQIFKGEHTTFSAVDGWHEAWLKDGRVKLKMMDVSLVKELNQGIFLETGSPHLVSFHEEIDSINVNEAGKEIRNSSEFQPEGTNVNFVAYKNGIIHIRTYERGVENETLSCGTGSVAAALAVSLKYQDYKNVYPLKAPGGDLQVSFDSKTNKGFQNVWLKGPVTFVFKGEIKV
jgi:diaminopimelate epimerase